QRLLKELTATVFTREGLLNDAEAIEKATKSVRDKESKAVAARREPPPGFGPPGAAAPQPPDLKTFAEKRTAADAAQLAGTRKGYVPQFTFGPPPGGGFSGPGAAANARPIDEQTFRREVSAPAGFDVTLYAAPPKVSYPVAIGAGPSGEIYVAVD